MKHLGHPLFGDAAYGGQETVKGTVYTKYKQFVDNCFKIMPRQALHAKTLGFLHPQTKRLMTFDSEMPPDFTELLAKWENYIKYN
jgi:23S rRNA pseudouridine1911/1915/1917 synthase